MSVEAGSHQEEGGKEKESSWTQMKAVRSRISLHSEDIDETSHTNQLEIY